MSNRMNGGRPRETAKQIGLKSAYRSPLGRVWECTVPILRKYFDILSRIKFCTSLRNLNLALWYQ